MGILHRLRVGRRDELTNSERSERITFYREWERQRANAISASDLAEIDAIFARSNGDWS